MSWRREEKNPTNRFLKYSKFIKNTIKQNKEITIISDNNDSRDNFEKCESECSVTERAVEFMLCTIDVF